MSHDVNEEVEGGGESVAATAAAAPIAIFLVKCHVLFSFFFIYFCSRFFFFFLLHLILFCVRGSRVFKISNTAFFLSTQNMSVSIT